jgi:RNA polymerase sigma-70 factor (ECF subfamily)
VFLLVQWRRHLVKVVSANSGAELSDLVRRVIDGDSAAEDEIVSRYSRGVCIVINRIVRSQSDAEDVSQQTFRIVIEKLRHGDLREPERLSGFVCGVARNTALDYVRRARNTRSLDGSVDIAQIPDPAPSQLDRILAEEKASAVRRVIGELKRERDKELLFRYYVAEQDKEKICAQMKLSSAQFNNVIFRATVRFKELYVRLIHQIER